MDMNSSKWIFHRLNLWAALISGHWIEQTSHVLPPAWWKAVRRFFAGADLAQIAAIWQVSETTGKRVWQFV